MEVVRIVSERNLPFLCVLREQEVRFPRLDFVGLTAGADAIASEMQAVADAAPETTIMVSGYNRHGHYIGDEKTTRFIVLECKISPEIANPGDHICSVGWCDSERKWYGWSHRAMFGFGIGETIKKGDCAYRAPDSDSFGRQVMDFHLDDERWYLDRQYKEAVNARGERGVLISAIYSDEVPNERLRGTRCEYFSPYPKAFGRGEWVVRTLDEARIAACDFAESVS